MTVGAAASDRTGRAAVAPDRAALPAAPELTFVFTDIERSTALLERLGAGYGDVLATHAELVRALLEDHRGHEVDTQGDAFFCVFTDPVASIVFAADLQRRLVVEAWPQGASVRLRIGVHTGSADLRRTGYVGLDVHTGARVAAAGHGGQVLISSATATRAQGGLPDGLAFASLGLFRLKDIREPVELLQLAGPGLEADFPPPRTLDTPEEPPAPGDPPYIGLARFEEVDAGRFFGREALIGRLVARLGQQPFLAIVGASGSGKSSLVRAGLLPALRRGLAEQGHEPRSIALLTPTDEPMAALDAALAELPGPPRVVVVDQLEELFTLVRDEATRDGFVQRLLRLHDDGAQLVVTLRADFYDRLAAFGRLRALAAEHQEYLGPLSRDELRRAIEGPAVGGGWRFDPGLIELIVHDVGDEPGGLPLLSHAIRETWQRRQGTLLTLRGYLDSGGVQRAIARTADETIGALEGSEVVLARDILVRLTDLGEESLDTRRRASVTELVTGQPDPASAQVVLDRLVAARLVVLEGAEAEVAHEALIREWPMLREWLEDDRDGLRLHRLITLAARDWEASERDAGLLLRGGRLAQAREWLAAHPSVSTFERAYIEASHAAELADVAEREALRERELEAAQALAASQASAAARLRRRALALAGLLGVAVLAAGFAVIQLQRADEATLEARDQAQLADVRETEAIEARLAAEEREREAVEQQRLALSRQLSAQSASSREDLDLSLLLAVEAGRVADTHEARSGLLSAVSVEPRLTRFLEHGLEVVDVEFGPDGTITGKLNGIGAALWDAESGQRLALVTPDQIPVDDGRVISSMSIAPGGRWLVLSEDAVDGGQGKVAVWDLERAERVGEHSSTGSVQNLTFTPDGRRVVFTDDSGLATWEWADAGRSTLLTPSPAADGGDAWFGVHSLALSHDGSRVGAVLANDSIGFEGMFVAWDVTSGAQAGPPIPLEEASVIVPAFSADGEMIAVGTSGGLVTLRRTASGEPIGEPIQVDHPVGRVAFGRDGTLLAVASAWDRRITLWDLETGQPVEPPLMGHRHTMLDVSFAPDGHTMVSSARDGTVLLWDVDRFNRLAERLVAAEDAEPTKAAALAGDGSLMAIVMLDASVLLEDLAERRTLGAPLPAHQGEAVTAVEFSPDGDMLVTAGRDGTIRRWDSRTQAPIGGPVPAHGESERAGPGNAAIRGLAFDPDGTILISGGNDGLLRRWDPATGDPIGEPYAADSLDAGPAEEFIFDIEFSPDGRTYASAGDRSSVLWDATTHTQIGEPFGGHTNSVVSIAFSPDGHLLAAGDADGSLRVWDVSTRELVLEPMLHADMVDEVAFSPSGDLIAVAVGDGTIVLWDRLSGRRVGEPLAAGGSHWVRFSPDGRLLSVAEDGSTLAWDLDEGRWAAIACHAAGRDLMASERAPYVGIDAGPTCG